MIRVLGLLLRSHFIKRVLKRFKNYKNNYKNLNMEGANMASSNKFKSVAVTEITVTQTDVFLKGDEQHKTLFQV